MMGRDRTTNSSFVAGEPGRGENPEQRPATLTPEERDYVRWAAAPFRLRFGHPGFVSERALALETTAA
jgi:hypothetical protein